MKRVAIFIFLLIISTQIYGMVNSVWVNTYTPMVFNDEDVDSIEYVLNTDGKYEQRLYSHDSVYITILSNELSVNFNYNGISTEKEVDLGLPSGTIWAGYNIGASSPEETGGFYHFSGIVESDTAYYNDWLKYTDIIRKNIGESSISGTEYDAARYKWGDDWQIPTIENYFELMGDIDDIWWNWGDNYYYNMYAFDANTSRVDARIIKFRGINGMALTSRINGERLFFPATGHENGYYCDEGERLQRNGVGIQAYYGISRLLDIQGTPYVLYPVFMSFDVGYRVSSISESFCIILSDYCIGCQIRAVKINSSTKK